MSKLTMGLGLGVLAVKNSADKWTDSTLVCMSWLLMRISGIYQQLYGYHK